MRLRRLLLGALLCLGVAPAPSFAAGPELIEVTDVVGRTVTVRAPVSRVVLGEGRQLYLAALLDRENPLQRVVAWRDDLIKADPDTYAQYLARFPEIAELPTVGGVGQGQFDAEQAVALSPDLLVLGIDTRSAVEDSSLEQTLAALDIPIVYVDFRYHPMENTAASVRLLGRLFGQEERAEAFLAFREAQIRRVTDVIEAQKPRRPAVFVERIGGYTTDCCLSFGDGNIGRLVALAGGHNIGSDLLPATFGQINPEQVLASDPEHVVVTSARWEAYVPGGDWIGVGPGADLEDARRRLERYLDKPSYHGIAARRHRRFHALWHQFYNSPFQMIALQRLAAWFHPELFPDLDPDATFRDLHERFLPVGYAPGYFVSLR